MSHQGPKEKHGSVMLMKTLIGAIIGLMIVVFLIILVKPFLVGMSDSQQQEFNDFKDKIVEIAKSPHYTSDTMLLTLEPDYAIIGFGPVQSVTNGRFGNGEFFYAINKRADGGNLNTKRAFTGQHMYLDRDAVMGCADTEACLCLCKSPSSELSDDRSEQEEHTVDKDLLPNPYTDDWVEKWVAEDLEKFYTSPNFFGTEMYELVCKELSCVPLEATTFQTIMPCQCYFSKEGENDCDYTFENGFAIYNRKEDITVRNGMAYEESLPPSVQVTIDKLPNGAVAVALNSSYTETLESITR